VIVDFELDPDQRAVLDAVATVLDRQAGPQRAREIGTDGHDDALLAALSDGGFLDLARDEDAGPLVAALIAERVAAAVGRVNIGPRTLVAPAVLGDSTPPRVALALASSSGPDSDLVRFGQHADLVLVLDGAVARVVEPTNVGPVTSKFGYPFARLDLSGGRSLGPGTGDLLRRWWQVALSAETVGTLSAALDRTIRYLGERVQFGQTLASRPALQHRLAEAHITVEGIRWLARSAAWQDADRELAAAAAGQAAVAAQALGTDLHQLTGAIGFTNEYDLHLWTTRAHALRLELGGATTHFADLAATRWA
jgi:alkylation response protein AidB-like acyl-CoA dehydrogenase